MMKSQYFCSQESRQSGVDIIGTASEHNMYIAIECSPPWQRDDLDSKGIPDDLRQLANTIDADYDNYQTRFLLIHNDQLQQENLIRVLVFRKPSGLASAYDKQEFHLRSINDVANLLRQIVMEESGNIIPLDNPSRDLFICTHGSRDRCCSRFGVPIYHQARKLVREMGLKDTRIWQTSHIGGHRMAPTAIDFPSARYYGYVDLNSLESLLSYSGDINTLRTIYRGSGLLPWAVQILEKELLVTHGWKWFNYTVTGRILEHNEEETYNRVELLCQPPTGERQIYQAEIIANKSLTCKLKGSCKSEKISSIFPYDVHNLRMLSSQLLG